MDRALFISHYQKFKLSKEDLDHCLQTIIRFEEHAKKDIKDTSILDIKQYVSFLIAQNDNKYKNLIHIARYYYYINKKENYIHMTTYFNSAGVLENIVDRITLYASKEDKEAIIKDLDLPPFGTESSDLPEYTKEFMKTLNKHLPIITCNSILAGNNHGIPKETFDQEKEYYQKANTLKQYLKERHKRKVLELENHLKENRVWFEQIITEEVIEYVKSNQEILSGVLEDEKLYITKIPFDTKKFLEADTDLLKRYYACHCTFVRESIKDGKEDIPKEWCYCSGGFAKFPFEQILENTLDITLLKTPIDGDYVCRFVIDLSKIAYKK